MLCKCKQVTGADTEIEWKRALEETSISSISSGVQPAVKPEPREGGRGKNRQCWGGICEGWTLSDIMMWKMTSTISYLLSKPAVIDTQCTQFLTEVTYRHTPRRRQVMQGAWYDKRAIYLWCSCWKIGTGLVPFSQVHGNPSWLQRNSQGLRYRAEEDDWLWL